MIQGFFWAVIRKYKWLKLFGSLYEITWWENTDLLKLCENKSFLKTPQFLWGAVTEPWTGFQKSRNSGFPGQICSGKLNVFGAILWHYSQLAWKILYPYGENLFTLHCMIATSNLPTGNTMWGMPVSRPCNGTIWENSSSVWQKWF